MDSPDIGGMSDTSRKPEILAGSLAILGEARAASTRARRLTPSARASLLYAAAGVTTESAAERLRINISTMYGHRRSAMRTMGADTMAEAVYLASLAGVLGPVQPLDSPALTGREWRAARMLALGARTPAVAAELGITVHSAGAALSGLYQRIGARSGAHAVAMLHRCDALSHCPLCGADAPLMH